MKYGIAYIISKFLDVFFFQKRLPGIPVLMYHAIGSEPSKLFVSAEAFEKQMQFLFSRGFRSILPDELAGAALNKKVFLITFDDGFTSVSDVALPILNRFGFKATVFVATDYIEKKSTYARSGQDKLLDLMSEDEIQALAESGWCIANHFASHRNLTELPANEVQDEYNRSCEVLERMGLGRHKNIVSYPFNRYSKEVIRVLQQAGVFIAFNGGNQLHTQPENQLAISRIESDSTIAKFKLHFSPTFNHIKQYVR